MVSGPSRSGGLSVSTCSGSVNAAGDAVVCNFHQVLLRTEKLKLESKRIKVKPLLSGIIRAPFLLRLSTNVNVGGKDITYVPEASPWSQA